MVNTQLLDYVKQQLAQGLNKETIQHNLASSGGWALSDINEAFSVLGVNQGVPISTAGAIPTTPVKYAGFWVRFVAIMVDSLVLALPVGLVQFAFGVVFSSSLSSARAATVVGDLVYLLITWVYFTWMTYAVGATLGKMLVGIRVKSDDFQRLSFGRVLLRETIGKLVSGIILCIGYIIAGVTQRKQALHDKFAHSVVIYNDPSKPHTAGLVVGIIIACILPAIAIVGILASIVLVSLNVAREKGRDAQTISALQQIRTEAELYYSSNNNSYSVAKDCSSGMFASENMQKTITSIPNVMPSQVIDCYADGKSYAVSAVMMATTTSYCVDSSGYGDNGQATYDTSKAYCNPSVSLSDVTGRIIAHNDSVSQNSLGPQPVSTDAYSLTLPSGWIIAQNGLQGLQALNQNSGYLLSITATAVPSLYGNITSVDQVTTMDELKSSLVKKYPNAVTKSASTGTIGGKKAYIMNYDMSASDLTGTQNQGQSKQMSITEYTTVDNGNVYTLAFISALSDKATAQNDLQAIVNSFKFKQ